jgi:hypothetical protein
LPDSCVGTSLRFSTASSATLCLTWTSQGGHRRWRRRLPVGFWTLFGPYTGDRCGPHGNGPTHEISNLGHHPGAPQNARNQLEVLVFQIVVQENTMSCVCNVSSSSQAGCRRFRIGGVGRIRNKFVTRLCLDAFCAFSEFEESITCDLSMAP